MEHHSLGEVEQQTLGRGLTEINTIHCRKCGQAFIVLAEYHGYEIQEQPDFHTWLRLRGIRVPENISPYCLSCCFDSFVLRGPDHQPRAWGDAEWSAAYSFLLSHWRDEVKVPLDGNPNASRDASPTAEPGSNSPGN